MLYLYVIMINKLVCTLFTSAVHQHGFRKGKSVLSATVEFVESIIDKKDKVLGFYGFKQGIWQSIPFNTTRYS